MVSVQLVCWWSRWQLGGGGGGGGGGREREGGAEGGHACWAMAMVMVIVNDAITGDQGRHLSWWAWL